MSYYNLKEFSLKVYGKKSWEVLHVLSRVIGMHLSRRRTAATFKIQMKTNGEVYGVCERRQRTAKYIASAANFGYHVKEAISFLTNRSVNGKNFKEHLDEKVSMDCKEYSTQYANYSKITHVDTTVGYLRCLYEILIDRDESKIIKTYGQKLYEEVKGTPNDCFVSAQKEIYIQELNELKKRHSEREASIERECCKEMDQVREKFRLKRAENDKLETQELLNLQKKFGEDLVNEVERTLSIRFHD